MDSFTKRLLEVRRRKQQQQQQEREQQQQRRQGSSAGGSAEHNASSPYHCIHRNNKGGSGSRENASASPSLPRRKHEPSPTTALALAEASESPDLAVFSASHNHSFFDSSSSSSFSFFGPAQEEQAQEQQRARLTTMAAAVRARRRRRDAEDAGDHATHVGNTAECISTPSTRTAAQMSEEDNSCHGDFSPPRRHAPCRRLEKWDSMNDSVSSSRVLLSSLPPEWRPPPVVVSSQPGSSASDDDGDGEEEKEKGRKEDEKKDSGSSAWERITAALEWHRGAVTTTTAAASSFMSSSSCNNTSPGGSGGRAEADGSRGGRYMADVCGPAMARQRLRHASHALTLPPLVLGTVLAGQCCRQRPQQQGQGHSGLCSSGSDYHNSHDCHRGQHDDCCVATKDPHDATHGATTVSGESITTKAAPPPSTVVTAFSSSPSSESTATPWLVFPHARAAPVSARRRLCAVALDVETAGVSAAECDLVEIAAVELVWEPHAGGAAADATAEDEHHGSNDCECGGEEEEKEEGNEKSFSTHQEAVTSTTKTATAGGVWRVGPRCFRSLVRPSPPPPPTGNARLDARVRGRREAMRRRAAAVHRVSDAQLAGAPDWGTVAAAFAGFCRRVAEGNTPLGTCETASAEGQEKQEEQEGKVQHSKDRNSNSENTTADAVALKETEANVNDVAIVGDNSPLPDTPSTRPLRRDAASAPAAPASSSSLSSSSPILLMPPIVAHNAMFDVRFVSHHFARLGYSCVVQTVAAAGMEEEVEEAAEEEEANGGTDVDKNNTYALNNKDIAKASVAAERTGDGIAFSRPLSSADTSKKTAPTLDSAIPSVACTLAFFHVLFPGQRADLDSACTLTRAVAAPRPSLEEAGHSALDDAARCAALFVRLCAIVSEAAATAAAAAE